MVEPRIHLDPEMSLGAVEKLRGPLEDQLTSALQVAVEQVDDNYHGESVEQVTGELLEKTKSGLHKDIAAGFEPDQEQLRSVAASIVADNT
jgi:hypothetical protein